jgi:hypothetical protein
LLTSRIAQIWRRRIAPYHGGDVVNAVFLGYSELAL